MKPKIIYRHYKPTKSEREWAESGFYLDHNIGSNLIFIWGGEFEACVSPRVLQKMFDQLAKHGVITTKKKVRK